MANPKKWHDYGNVEIPDPDEKPRNRWNYLERRAEIAKLIIQVGHPRLINQTELANTYGVSQPQISQDLGQLKKYILLQIGKDADVIAETVFQKAISELIRTNPLDAVRAVKEWYEFLYGRGYLEKTADRHEVINKNITVSKEYKEFRAILDKIPEKEKKKALAIIKGSGKK